MLQLLGWEELRPEVFLSDRKIASWGKCGLSNFEESQLSDWAYVPLHRGKFTSGTGNLGRKLSPWQSRTLMAKQVLFSCSLMHQLFSDVPVIKLFSDVPVNVRLHI